MQNYVRDTRYEIRDYLINPRRILSSKLLKVPPTEDGEVQGGEGASSHNIVYRWSNDVSTDDTEIIGPFESTEDCLEAAIDADNCPEAHLIRTRCLPGTVPCLRNHWHRHLLRDVILPRRALVLYPNITKVLH